MATMEGLIGLVNRIQRACTVLGDYGGDSALPTLWESLPSVAVVGGQVSLSSLYALAQSCFLLLLLFGYLKLVWCVWLWMQSSGKSSVLESIVGRDFLPRGSG